MIGLIAGGSWLTERAARVLGRPLGGASALLAARRLSDNPKAAFRAVRGLVLAVFLGTVTAGLLPAVNATTATPSATALHNVLLDQFIYAPVCGNTVQARVAVGDTVERLVYIAVALTLLGRMTGPASARFE